jgi:signal transduction histidine kinase/phage shock protein PspC (stress-responsive transcriptional regulator)
MVIDPPAAEPTAAPPLVRVHEGRMVAGVCAGLGRHLGVDPLVLRLAAAVLTVANGLGLVAYAVAWAVVPDEAAVARRQRAGHAVDDPGRPERALAVGLITLGTLLGLRELGLLLPDGLVWPVTLGALGVALVWTRSSEEDRERWRAVTSGLVDPVEALRSGRAVVLRAVVGLVLLITGLAVLIGAGGAIGALGRVGVAVLATALGVVLLLGPWILRLWRDLATERRQRIRSEERAEVAAHLHDSVLQTLALIQRHADAPSQARTLARRQERELRSWLYGERDPSSPATLHAALDAAADAVEADHQVAVEVVVVGDCALDPPVEALAHAVREAMVNAARHAGVDEVSVYVEVEDGAVTAFVRDRGRGFDPAAVEPGRLGIAQSIVGRMARHGGRAEVQSAPGEGTEVVVEVPR